MMVARNKLCQKEGKKMTKNTPYPDAFLPNFIISHNLPLSLIPTKTFFTKEDIYRAVMLPQYIQTVFQDNLTIMTSKSLIKRF